MEQSLKKYCALLILCALCGCRHLGPYVSYAPIKESLSFIDNSVCVYTRYDIYNRDSITIIDTCFWKYHPNIKEYIVIYERGEKDVKKGHICSGDTDLNFVYNICPTWYNIGPQEFKEYADFKSPLYQDATMSLPLGLSADDRARINRRLHPTFADKYGSHDIISDTIVNYGSFILWLRKPLQPLVLFANDEPLIAKGKNEGLYEMATNSYEYVNYKENHDRKVSLNLDSLMGKQFSYIGELCKKESLRFINDSVCTYCSFMRASVASPFVSLAADTIRYSIRNNLVAIDFAADQTYDTLTYTNGILFYSKVYKDGQQYTQIVKPFIDEARSCVNKNDSINMIMDAYINAYVPLNLSK